ncbi:LamG-like jellyroll fold domain-containing protein [Ignavibacterium sp.]|uniref:LamG-like jellyroll fold domain-containing protein n=1 Tax=Ignavibacterium sp. TaxID=2651167 RepID=UPI00307E7D99
MRKKAFASILLLLVLTNAITIQSQWNQDPYINNPICTVPGFQNSPNITSDEKGGAYIVWEDSRNGVSKIYFQRIDNKGITKLSNNGLQLCDVNSGQSNPKIINDKNGGAIIVWVDDRNGNFDLYAQRIDSLGNRLWNSDGVIVFDNNSNQTQPQIVRTSDNYFYIVCIDDRMGLPNLFIQKLDLQGIMIWGENGKIGNHLRSLRNYKSIIDQNDNLVFVWEDFYFNNDGMIFAQKLDQNGNFLWEFNQDDLRLSSSDLNIQAQHPDIIQLQNGNYMIAWQDNRSGNFDIYGQIVLSNGANLLTYEGEHLEGNSGDDIMPELCLSGSRYYMIAWVNNNSSDSFVKVRSFYSDPVNFIQYWSQTITIAQQFNGGFNYLNFSSDKAGGTLLSFVSADAEYSDIWFAKISSYGDKRVGTICSADLNQGQLSVCSDSSDGIIAAWADLRSGDFDIYCSQVDANGIFAAGQHEIGLIADYRFSGDGSDAAYGNNATVLSATPTADRFGAANSAFEFNGSFSYLSAPSTVLLESPRYELTQTAWVYLYDWGINGNSFVPVIMKSNSPENAFQYRLALSPNTVITSINNWNNTVFQTGFNMNLNEWYMITSVLKEDTVFTYVNNEYVSYGLLTGPIQFDNKPLEIGRDVPGATEYFYGKLDDIKIFNRALGVEEVQNLYNYGTTTEVKNDSKESIPTEFSLEQNYPNPFNPSTKISWQSPVSGNQTLKIYDILGNEIATLINEYKVAGKYEVEFNASELTSGIYIYRLQVGDKVFAKKMTLMK